MPPGAELDRLGRDRPWRQLLWRQLPGRQLPGRWGVLALAFLLTGLGCREHLPDRVPPDTELRAWRDLVLAARRDPTDPDLGAAFLESALAFRASPNARRRRLSALEMSRSGHPAAADYLEEAYAREPRFDLKAELIRHGPRLGRRGRRAALELAAHGVLTGHPYLREAAARAYAELGSLGDLGVFLAGDDAELRRIALRALSRLPLEALSAAETQERLDRRLVSLLEATRSRAAPLLRAQVFHLWSLWPPFARRHRAELVAALDDPSELVVLAALEGLAPQGVEGLEAAIALVEDPDRWIELRRAARGLLENWRGAEEWASEGEAATTRAARLAAARGKELASEPAALPELMPPDGLRPASEERRLVRLLLGVEGKGRCLLRLESDLAWWHVDRLIEHIRRGGGATIRRDDPRGLWLELDESEDGGAARISSLPPEPHGARVVRGTLLRPAGAGPDELLLSLWPRPEWEGEATVLGRVILGGRLLEALEDGDRAVFELDGD